jgi:hypothetical protein
MIGDDIRWISARGEGGDSGIRDIVMLGIFLDISGRKLPRKATSCSPVK